MRLFALLCLLTFHSASYAFTFAPTTRISEPEFLPVEQAFQLSITSPKDGKLIASWQIHDGYYLYQEQFALSGEGADKLHFSPYPKGENKQDPYFGEVVVYHHKLSLPIYYDINLPPGTKINATLIFQGCAEKGLCYAPQKHPIQFTIPETHLSKLESIKASPQPKKSDTTTDNHISLSESQSISQSLYTGNLWSTLILLFGLGLLLSMTPCVLPMIPIVSAIVIGTRHSKLGAFFYSSVYVSAMAFTYAAIGGLVGIFGTQLNLQAQLQKPIFLMGSAILFVLLALAMFGIYELKLPSTWQQRLQTTTHSRDGLWKSTSSVFIAGVLSTLVVSPCVSAPLAGVLLYISGQGNAVYGASMLFIMALGMGVPLLLVGLFGPKILPKSGQWLDDIKVLMGFGLIAMSIWLINRWLPAYSHLYLWSFLALAISSYFIHRAYRVHSHPVRWFFALVFFLIGCIEFFGGTTGNDNPLQPLKSLNITSSDNSETKNLFSTSIRGLDELDQLVANQDTRPIVLDLYADWCVSCRILEEMFRSPEVSPMIDQVQLVRVDVTENSEKNQALMKQFGLFGPPSLVFLDAKGNERKPLTLIGEPTKSTLINRLNLVINQ